jgi:MscS family membrane protein
VAYGSDVDRVVEVLEAVAFSHDTVVKEPAPRVRMRGFGDSSLDFELLCWVDHPSERGLVTHQLFMEIYKSLGREGIEIPFPQRDVWVRQVPTGVVDGNGTGAVDASEGVEARV